MDAAMRSPVEDVAESRDLIGNDLLKSQAKALNDERHREHKGEDMISVDNMLHGFQTPDNKYDSLTEDLEKQAPKKDDLDVALTPDASGMVHFDEPEEKHSAIPDFSEDIEFVQSPEEWTPSGQDGLADVISKAKDDQEEDEMKEDMLEGHGVLSAVGLADDETQDPLLDLSLVQTEASWEPSGQEGLPEMIAQSKKDEQEEEDKENGLKGMSVLSAVGITKDADDVENADFSDEELGLVQVAVSADDGAWVPSGQSGLSSAIKKSKDEDEAAEMKEDGLKGHSMLSAAGMSDDTEQDDDEETMFIQDKVAEWTPVGQKVKAKDSQSYEEKKEKEEQESSYLDDGLDGDSLLSAVGLGDHMKPSDEAADLGTLKADDLDLDLV